MAIACSCHGLRDRDVIEAIHGGASSVEDVIESCRAGSRCGGCVPTIAALLDAEAALDAALGPVASSTAA